MPEIWTADAPGKLVLIGEYAVLEGYPAAVAAIDRRAKVRLAKGTAWHLDAPQLGIRELAFTIEPTGVNPSLPPQLGLVEEALQSFAKPLCKLPAFSISLDSGELMMTERGPKLGLGSSASLIAALTAVLKAYSGSHGSRDELLALVHALHFRFQGRKGSGIDVAAAVLGGCLRYQLGKDRQPDKAPRSIRLPDDLIWKAVWSGAPASTPELIGAVRKWSTAEPEAFSRLMARLGSISVLGVQALEAGDTPSFLRRVDQYEEAMRSLGSAASAAIVTDAHREIADIVRLAGGAYKPSGAGGGDLGLAFAGSPGILEEAEAGLAQAGYPIVSLALAENGFRVRHD